MFDQSGTKCTIDGLVLKKGDRSGHDDIQKIMSSCRQYNLLGINTIVVKGDNDLTIWIEEKSQTIQEAGVTKDDEVTRQPLANNQSLPTKTVTKQYRGQVYEEVVVDWAAMQQTNQQNKPRRKYRGQYID
ncbi:MAG TPA: hypothetical protein V6C71_02120 [Coleofasciculaceae cyanobacterium]